MIAVKVSPAVETLYEDYETLAEELQKSPSGLTAINRTYNKQLLIAAASSLEDNVKAAIPELFEHLGTEQLRAFVTKQVFSRGYHTLFDWKVQKATIFFSSFGEACANAFKTAYRDDLNFRSETDAFMLLGAMRNDVVHNDYASQNISFTPADILEKYRLAINFVNKMEDLIRA